MNKRILSIASVLLIAALAFSNAFAGSIKISGVTFSLGSLISNGTLSGVGNTNVTVVLDASGIPAITCINNGSNPVPGQSYPKVSAEGTQALKGGNFTKNGKLLFGVETKPPAQLTWDQAGCPNSNWTAVITFVYWTNATITVHDTATWLILAQQNYACTTTLTSVTCTPIN